MKVLTKYTPLRNQLRDLRDWTAPLCICMQVVTQLDQLECSDLLLQGLDIYQADEQRLHVCI